MAGWAGGMANTWRTVPEEEMNWKNLQAVLTKQDGLERYAEEEAWNDPGTLVLTSDLTDS